MTASIDEHSAIGPDPQIAAPGAARPRRKVVSVVIWCLLLVLVFALLHTGHRHHEEAQKATSLSRRGATRDGHRGTDQAQKGDIGVYLDAIGTVTPGFYTDLITSQVNGLVLAVQYEEGQRVRKGDPLIDMDFRPYRATLLQAQGALEQDDVLAGADGP